MTFSDRVGAFLTKYFPPEGLEEFEKQRVAAGDSTEHVVRPERTSGAEAGGEINYDDPRPGSPPRK
ncbi:hypothetical protein A3K55_01875 [Candidatus Shapirobacteria bacterium RBG_13_44_7]|uniref:Uncharacterized protein n=1 Tax=Candidatus Shapirobacteria bacterium RBG_13_44_7 TaxID=1802149 RepID=A0A1F7SEP8_9BACT|nr:MAG: hypothetical protein A3K55_01875 [Candidatus Shapirobacteria bacterium RBG_13_44_7]